LGEISSVKIWVTGGNGSLGQSLRESLHLNGYSSLLIPSRDELDLRNLKDVHDFVAKHQPTHVFHLAAKVFGIAGHKEKPEQSLLENSLIDNAVFASLFAFPPKWVYYASTVAAYGYPYHSLPLDEEDFLLGTPHESEFGYAASKRFALNYLKLLKEKNRTSFVYGLSTNLFGSGDRFLEGRGHVVISLLEKAKICRAEKSELAVWGNGTASRDFLSTTDAANILISLIDVDAGVVNIASGQEIFISEIVQNIVQEFDLKAGFKFIGINEGITNRVCSTVKLASLSDAFLAVDSRKRLIEEIRHYALRE
jgi:GDP-L-fucose synthase